MKEDNLPSEHANLFSFHELVFVLVPINLVIPKSNIRSVHIPLSVELRWVTQGFPPVVKPQWLNYLEVLAIWKF